VFHELVRDRRNQYLMIDSAIVRAHQQAATGAKKRGSDKGSGALLRRCDDEDPSAGRWARFAGGLRRHRGAGERLDPGDRLALGERKVSHVLADKGYDTDAIVEHVAAMGTIASSRPSPTAKCDVVWQRPLQT
jgi:hypothetical protein